MASPRFAVSEFSTLNRSYEEDLAAFVAGGAEGIGVAEAKLADGRDAESLDRFRQSGLTATICLPTLLSILPNLLSPEPADPEERIAALSASIRRFAPFEPVVVLCLTGAQGDRDGSDARATAVEGLRELASVARQEGVVLGLEPIHRSAGADFSLVTDLPGAEDLLAEVGDESIAIVFDTWHLWDTPDVLTHARRLAPRFAGVHVNDWREETRHWDDRALPGQGIMDLPAILGAVDAGGYGGWYEMEIFSSETYPDSLLKLDAVELVRRGREGFLEAWEARTG